MHLRTCVQRALWLQRSCWTKRTQCSWTRAWYNSASECASVIGCEYVSVIECECASVIGCEYASVIGCECASVIGCRAIMCLVQLCK